MDTDGKLIWETHLAKQLGGRCPTWGFAGAPLLVNEKVIVQTGGATGSLVALHAKTGKEIWRGGSAEAGYATPYQRKSEPNDIVVFNQEGLSVHDLLSGREKISYQHRTRYEVNAAQPLDLGSQILVMSGYGKGAALLELQHNPECWESDGGACQMASLVFRDGYATDSWSDGTNAMRATLFCLELTEGRKSGRNEALVWAPDFNR